MKTEKSWIDSGFEVFTRIFMKYDVLGRKPLDIGNGIKINASHMHTIEAIGKGFANTVTSLAEYFLITKGAVSQVISKLDKDGYIKKISTGSKLVVLELTELGDTALRSHDHYNQSKIEKIQRIEDRYTAAELELFLKILSDVDAVFGTLIEESK